MILLVVVPVHFAFELFRRTDYGVSHSPMKEWERWNMPRQKTVGLRTWENIVPHSEKISFLCKYQPSIKQNEGLNREVGFRMQEQWLWHRTTSIRRQSPRENIVHFKSLVEPIYTDQFASQFLILFSNVTDCPTGTIFQPLAWHEQNISQTH